MREKDPCPKCNSPRVKLQTPAEEDGMVRRCYFRCFDCGWVTSNYPDWQEVHWKDSGKLPYAPLEKFYEQERAREVINDSS